MLHTLRYMFFVTRFTEIGRKTSENKREVNEICLCIPDICESHYIYYSSVIHMYLEYYTHGRDRRMENEKEELARYI